MIKYRSIINAKFSDNVTLGKKAKAWEKITASVNCINVNVQRTTDEIKKRWQDIKQSTKSKEAQRRKELKKTGGGDADIQELNPIEEKAVAIIGTAAMEGVPGGVDTHEEVEEGGNRIVEEEEGEGETVDDVVLADNLTAAPTALQSPTPSLASAKTTPSATPSATKTPTGKYGRH